MSRTTRRPPFASSLIAVGVLAAAALVSPPASAADAASPGAEVAGASYVPGDSNFIHAGTIDVTDANGSGVAEINDITDDGTTIYYTDAENGEVGIIDVTDPANPTGAGTIPVGDDPTSLAVAGDHLLVAVNTSADYVNVSGSLRVYDSATAEHVADVALPGQPDSIAISPDGTYAAVVIENERNEDLNGGLLPQLPSGDLAIFDITGAPATWSPVDADLAVVAAAATDGSDLEPEYVHINDNNEAVLTFQENNHLGVVDLATGAATVEFPAGAVDLRNIDATEDGDVQFTESIDARRREPDAVVWLNDTMFATANEGDYEDADGVEGGSRGWTVFNTAGEVVYESGSDFEHLLASAGHYNEDRSENKGVEPESITHGVYGDDDLTIVASERASAAVVYDTSDPAAPVARQLVATGISPEGVNAVPEHNMLLLSTEVATDDVGSMVSIYTYENAPAEYPNLISGTESDAPVPWVAISGMVGDPSDPTTVYAVSDSFLDVGYVYTIDVAASPATLTERLAVNIEGLDLEGIAVGADGNFWLASEGDDETANVVYVVDPDTGDMVAEYPLPASLDDRGRTNGFEGVAVTGAPGAEVVHLAIQRAWPDAGDEDEVETRIARLDVATGEWTYVHYPLEAEGAGGWIGLSELTALPNGNFAIIERDKGWGDTTGNIAELKALYEVDLAGAAFAADGEELVTLDKTLLYDALPEMQATSVITQEKLEGFAVTADKRSFLSTDNDGVDEVNAETMFFEVELELADPVPETVVPVSPDRYWDTRDEATLDDDFTGTGRVAATESHRVQIAGRGDVPADAVGVVANLTVIDPGELGYATLYPCGDAVPTASQLNYLAGEVLANNAVVPLDDEGGICVYTLAEADFALDVNGFVPAGSGLTGLLPTRYLDTRQADDTVTFDGEFQGIGPLAAGEFVEVPVAGRGDVPADASAVLVNLTAVTPDADGYLTLYPCGERPGTSTINYAAGQFTPNGAIVPLSDTGSVCIYSLAASDVLLDVSGFVPADAEGVDPVTPVRLVDTRADDSGRVDAETLIEVQVAGTEGIPADATAVFSNVAAVFPDGPGYVTLYPCGDVPTTSNVNHVNGDVVMANNALTQLSADGTVCVYTKSGTDIVIDATAYLS